MKVLSIKQPWATLILEGYKEYEFRTWRTKYRGELYIHASKTIDTKALKYFSHLNLEIPTGCIIGKVKLVNCIEVNEEFENQIISKNEQVYNYTKIRDGYAWNVIKPKKINPIYINGKLGIWEYKK